MRIRLFCISSFVLAIIFLFVGTVKASFLSLETIFDSNNAHEGIMFDIETGNTPITLEQFGLSLTGGNIGYKFYLREGTHIGYENNSSAWSLIDSTSNLETAGSNNETIWNFNSYTLNANTRYALYLTSDTDTDGLTRYTNGTSVNNLLASDAHLSIYEGTGKEYPFSSNFRPRQFNGVIYYSTEASAGSSLVYQNTYCKVYESDMPFDSEANILNVVNKNNLISILSDIVLSKLTFPTSWYSIIQNFRKELFNPVALFPFFSRNNAKFESRSGLTEPFNVYEICQNTKIVPAVALDFLRIDADSLWEDYIERVDDLNIWLYDPQDEWHLNARERITLLTAKEIKANLNHDRSYLIVPKFSWDFSEMDRRFNSQHASIVAQTYVKQRFGSNYYDEKLHFDYNQSMCANIGGAIQLLLGDD